MKRNTRLIIALAAAAAVGGSTAVLGLKRRAGRKLKKNEAGRISDIEKRLLRIAEEVDAASEDSFPASDAPAWTGTIGPTSPRR